MRKQDKSKKNMTNVPFNEDVERNLNNPHKEATTDDLDAIVKDLESKGVFVHPDNKKSPNSTPGELALMFHMNNEEQLSRAEFVNIRVLRELEYGDKNTGGSHVYIVRAVANLKAGKNVVFNNGASQIQFYRPSMGTINSIPGHLPEQIVAIVLDHLVKEIEFVKGLEKKKRNHYALYPVDLDNLIAASEFMEEAKKCLNLAYERVKE